jgi:hypothetical protein
MEQSLLQINLLTDRELHAFEMLIVLGTYLTGVFQTHLLR